MSVLSDPTALLRKARRRGAIVLLSVGIGVAAAYGVTMLIPPTYEARGSVLLTGGVAQDRIMSLFMDVGVARGLVPTVAHMAESRAVGVAAADRARIPERLVIGRISTEYQQDAQIVVVRARAATADQAAVIANAVLAAVSDQVARRQIDGAGAVGAQLLDRATPPANPVRPNEPLNLALGGMVGLIVGIGVGRLRDQLDDKVRDADDLREITGVPTLASVPFTRQSSSGPLTVDPPGSARSESFARLRTNLESVVADSRPQVVAVTSALAGEGKSVTSCKLAITLANAGRRVALVDADLRHPACSRYLGVRSQVGLTTVLEGRTELDATMISWGNSGLVFLPAGPPVLNPSELLASNRTPDILDAMRSRFDLVIVDLPALLQIPDATVLAGQLDGVLLVVRHRHTRAKHIRQSVDALNMANARTIGCVLTMTPSRDSKGTPRLTRRRGGEG